jgi:hypothetical protein
MSLGRTGERFGVSGGDIRRATGAKRVNEARLGAWLAEPPIRLVRCRKRKATDQRKKAAMVLVTCVVCGCSELRRPGTAKAVRDLVLACGDCDRAGRRPAVIVPPGWQLVKHPEVAGGFVGWELQEPLRCGSQEGLAEACLQAVKDGGDTDAWAAGVLHRVGAHAIGLDDGVMVPVLPPSVRVAE